MNICKPCLPSPCKPCGPNKTDCINCQTVSEKKDEIIEMLKKWWHFGGQKAPYIGENGNWYVWDQMLGEYKDTEVKAQGEVPDFTERFSEIEARLTALENAIATPEN